MNRFKKISLFLYLAFVGYTATAQTAPFYYEIQQFKKKDSIQAPPSHPILFIGSSSFTKWQDVQNYFQEGPILNRGFGGSSLPDLIRYAPDIIFPYHPKQIVIYCGDNDFASSDTVTAEVVVNRFKKLFTLIRDKLPQVPIAFVSVKPSPSRARLMAREVMANQAIRDFLAKEAHTAFIDVYHPMLGEDGKPLSAIFLSDSLHMNAHGYAIWKKAIEPYLIKQ